MGRFCFVFLPEIFLLDYVGKHCSLFVIGQSLWKRQIDEGWEISKSFIIYNVLQAKNTQTLIKYWITKQKANNIFK